MLRSVGVQAEFFLAEKVVEVPFWTAVRRPGPEGDEAGVKRDRIEIVSSQGVHFNVDRLQLGTSLLASEST